MKTHRFTLDVKTDETKRVARYSVLTAFASRNPDGCEFHLSDRTDTKAALCDKIVDELEAHCAAMIRCSNFFGEKPRKKYLSNLMLVKKYRGLLR